MPSKKILKQRISEALAESSSWESRYNILKSDHDFLLKAARITDTKHKEIKSSQDRFRDMNNKLINEAHGLKVRLKTLQEILNGFDDTKKALEADYSELKIEMDLINTRFAKVCGERDYFHKQGLQIANDAMVKENIIKWIMLRSDKPKLVFLNAGIEELEAYDGVLDVDVDEEYGVTVRLIKDKPVEGEVSESAIINRLNVKYLDRGLTFVIKDSEVTIGVSDRIGDDPDHHIYVGYIGSPYDSFDASCLNALRSRADPDVIKNKFVLSLLGKQS